MPNNTIKFKGHPHLGDVVSEFKPFCALTKKMPIPDLSYIIGDFKNPNLPSLAGHKWSRLCGFTFKSNVAVDHKIFQFVYVPKLNASYLRNNIGLSGWYCWEYVAKDHRNVISIETTMNKYSFDINAFVFSDVFETYVKAFVSNVSYALDNQIKELFNSLDSEQQRQLKFYANAVKNSLGNIYDVQQFAKDKKWKRVDLDDGEHYVYVTAQDDENDNDAHAKLAYNANKDYKLVNIDKHSPDPVVKESILDAPKPDLCKDVWRKTTDGSYELTDDATSKIQSIVDWAQTTFKIPEMIVHVTGSIASNSYSTNSDVDLHFASIKFKKDKADEFNKMFRSKFAQFIDQNPQLKSIGPHDIEVYMQSNPYQDLMSVGCYDFLNKRWLVGPELKDVSFDPYSTYFMKDMRNVDDVIDDVRTTILKIYEMSVAFIKSNDNEFKESLAKKLKTAMAKAASIFDQLREKRSHKSQPSSVEDALKNRDDKDWKIADSSFKLLDKLGYLNILKTCKTNLDRFDEDMSDIEMAIKQVLQTIADKISTQALNDNEQFFYDVMNEVERCNESLSSMVKMSIIASLMSIPSILPAQKLENELNSAKQQAAVQKTSFNVNSNAVKTSIKNASVGKNEMVGQMSEANVANAIAQVLWKEARGEGDAGIKAVASVIWNRAGGDPQYFVDVIKQKKQFSCLNKYAGGWTDKTYRWYNPPMEDMRNPTNQKIWSTCKDVAAHMIQKDFKSTIGNRNIYANEALDDKSNLDAWGKDCDLNVGNHKFGYSKAHDPKIVKPGTFIPQKKGLKIIVVKAGDTLSKIAKQANTTVSKLLELNKDIKNPNAISIGQKVRIA